MFVAAHRLLSSACTPQYLVFRGRKRFRLFSPDMAGRMATHGRITRVRPNGVMDYARDEQVRRWARAREA